MLYNSVYAIPCKPTFYHSSTHNHTINNSIHPPFLLQPRLHLRRHPLLHLPSQRITLLRSIQHFQRDLSPLQHRRTQCTRATCDSETACRDSRCHLIATWWAGGGGGRLAECEYADRGVERVVVEWQWCGRRRMV